MDEHDFDGYRVYTDNNKYVFYVLNGSYIKKYDSIFEWAFSNDKLLRYADFDENDLLDEFGEAEKKTIYMTLKKFIDDYNIGLLPFDDKYKDIKEILNDENLLIDDGGTLKVRQDKIGKIGEYFFYNILCDFFSFACIINKVNLLTSYNMSVYGMDELFYSSEDNMLVFGESKFSNSLENGIALINKSLSEYENRLNSEYELIFSNHTLNHSINLPDNIKRITKTAFSFDDFIKEASIDTIGIPVFIMHGCEENKDVIVEKLYKIKQNTIRGLKVKYILISLPIHSKKEFTIYLTNKLSERIGQDGK